MPHLHTQSESRGQECCIALTSSQKDAIGRKFVGHTYIRSAATLANEMMTKSAPLTSTRISNGRFQTSNHRDQISHRIRLVIAVRFREAEEGASDPRLGAGNWAPG